MFSVTHFRSEFIQQNQATIIRKVTMTQFMLVIVLTAMGVGLLNAPFWLAPLFIVTGYAAGYTHNGEIVLKRLIAYLMVWLRSLVGAPQLVNVQAEWDIVRRASAIERVDAMALELHVPVSRHEEGLAALQQEFAALLMNRPRYPEAVVSSTVWVRQA